MRTVAALLLLLTLAGCRPVAHAEVQPPPTPLIAARAAGPLGIPLPFLRPPDPAATVAGYLQAVERGDEAAALQFWTPASRGPLRLAFPLAFERTQGWAAWQERRMAPPLIAGDHAAIALMGISPRGGPVGEVVPLVRQGRRWYLVHEPQGVPAVGPLQPPGESDQPLHLPAGRVKLAVSWRSEAPLEQVLVWLSDEETPRPAELVHPSGDQWLTSATMALKPGRRWWVMYALNKHGWGGIARYMEVGPANAGPSSAGRA